MCERVPVHRRTGKSSPVNRYRHRLIDDALDYIPHGCAASIAMATYSNFIIDSDHQVKDAIKIIREAKQLKDRK